MNLEAVSVKGAILTGALLESLIGAIRNMNWTQFDGRATLELVQHQLPKMGHKSLLVTHNLHK
ncbi:MAG: hypothetical protein ACLP3R_14060 [Candidatus Korobacteraceae bacterium]|jgi:hypothetical protein